jgi:hypothetical protein
LKRRKFKQIDFDKYFSQEIVDSSSSFDKSVDVMNAPPEDDFFLSTINNLHSKKKDDRQRIKLKDKEEKLFQEFWKSNPNVQAWKKNLGNLNKSPDDELDKYDYRKAWQAGDEPQINPVDNLYHWGSIGKDEDHPTAWKQKYFEQTGLNPDELLFNKNKNIKPPLFDTAIQETTKQPALLADDITEPRKPFQPSIQQHELNRIPEDDIVNNINLIDKQLPILKAQFEKADEINKSELAQKYNSLIDQRNKLVENYYKIFPGQKYLAKGVLEAVNLQNIISPLKQIQRTPKPLTANEEYIPKKSSLEIIPKGKDPLFGLEYKGLRIPLNTPGGRLISSFVQGAAAIPEGVFGAAEYLGDQFNFKDVKGVSRKTAKNINRWVRSIAPENPNFVEELASGAGSMAIFLPFGIGASTVGRLLGSTPKIANLFGVGAATFLESATEAGQVYNESKSEAAAEKTFLANMVLIGVTNKFGIFADRVPGLKKMLLSTPLEGLQEAGQEIIQAKAQGKEPDWNNVIKSAQIGTIIGGGASFVDTSTREKPIDDIRGKKIPIEFDPKLNEEINQRIEGFGLTPETGLNQYVLDLLSPKEAQIDITPDKLTDEVFGKQDKSEKVKVKSNEQKRKEVDVEDFVRKANRFQTEDIPGLTADFDLKNIHQPIGKTGESGTRKSEAEKILEKGKDVEYKKIPNMFTPAQGETIFNENGQWYRVYESGTSAEMYVPPEELDVKMKISPKEAYDSFNFMNKNLAKLDLFLSSKQNENIKEKEPKSYLEMPSYEDFLKMSVGDVQDFELNRYEEMQSKLQPIDERIKNEKENLNNYKGRSKVNQGKRKKIKSNINELNEQKSKIKDEYESKALNFSLELRERISEKAIEEKVDLPEDEIYQLVDDVLVALDPRYGKSDLTVDELISDTIADYKEKEDSRKKTDSSDKLKDRTIEKPSKQTFEESIPSQKTIIEQITDETNGRYEIDIVDGKYKAIDQASGNPVSIGGNVTDSDELIKILKAHAKRNPEANYGLKKVEESEDRSSSFDKSTAERKETDEEKPSDVEASEVINVDEIEPNESIDIDKLESEIAYNKGVVKELESKIKNQELRKTNADDFIKKEYENIKNRGILTDVDKISNRIFKKSKKQYPDKSKDYIKIFVIEQEIQNVKSRSKRGKLKKQLQELRSSSEKGDEGLTTTFTPAQYLSDVPTPNIIKEATAKLGGIDKLQEAFEKANNDELANLEKEKGTLLESFARHYLAEEAVKNIKIEEKGSVSDISKNFNKQLDEYVSGKLRSDVIFNLGKPSKVLKKTGVPNLEISLTQKVIKTKTGKHNYPVESLKDLPDRINDPIMVFPSKTQPNSKVVLTGIKYKNRNFVVALKLDETAYRGRKAIQVNDIKSIYPKDFEKIINWIKEGNVDYVNKKKGLKWFEDSAGSNYPQRQTIQNLISNIADKFEKSSGKDVGKKEGAQEKKDLQVTEKSLSLHNEEQSDETKSRNIKEDTDRGQELPHESSESGGISGTDNEGKQVDKGRKVDQKEVDKGLRKSESDIERSSSTSKLPTATKSVEGQSTVSRDAGDISEPSQKSMVSESTEPGDRDVGVRESSYAKASEDANYDLRNKEPIRLTKSQRRKINEKVREILQSKKAGELSDEDREILRQYTGEGGLSSGEGKGALNQHYTDYPVIKSIFDALDKSGFDYKNVLEPAAGSGNFVGMKPDKNWTTVDIDKTNHDVTKYLYPKGTHYNLSYEQFKDTGYDLVISNVPFSEERGAGKLNIRPDIKALHDFYFIHSLDRVKPNGLIVFITSKGTMDKVNQQIRNEILSKADFITAYRLPGGTFEKNAHTDVITDIIVLQKRPEGYETKNADKNYMFSQSDKVLFVDGGFVGSNDGVFVNMFYQNFPEKILGKPEMGKNKLYGGKLNLNVTGEPDLSKIKIEYEPYRLKEKEKGRKGEIEKYSRTEKIPDRMQEFESWASENGTKYRISSDPRFKENIAIKPNENSVYHRDYIQEFSDVELKAKAYIELPLNDKNRNKIIGLYNLKQVADEIQSNKKFGYKEKVESIIKEYRERFKVHPKNDKKLKNFFKEYNEESLFHELSSFFTKDWKPESVFTKQVRFEKSGELEINEKSTLAEKALFNENIHGVINLKSSKYLSENDLVSLLEQGYSIIEESKVQNDVLYYSGNVYKKIEEAEELKHNVNDEVLVEKLNQQIEELENIKPEIKTIEDIDIKGNESWFKNFINKVFPGWIENYSDKSDRILITSGYGKIYDNYLNNNQLVSLEEKDSQGNVRKLSENEIKARIVEAEEKVREIKEEIKDKIRSDHELLEQIQFEYNRKYKNYVKPDYTKASYLIDDVISELPKKTPNGQDFSLRKNQIDWVVKALYEGKGINAHDVGGGKTFAAITLARVLKKKGIAKKPVFVVPAKTIRKWERDIKFLFPNAKICNLGNLSKNKRKEKLYEVANNEFDYVLISHEGFGQIKLNADDELKYFNKVVDENITDPEKVGRSKELELEKIARFREIIKRSKRDENLTFDKLGFDSIVVDEAHAYKNIGINGDLVKFGAGIAFGVNVNTRKLRKSEVSKEESEGKYIITDSKGSKFVQNVNLKSARSYDFRFKSQFITEKNNGKNVFLLTATPTPNKPMEVFTMLRHLDTEILQEYGIHTDRDFANTFMKFGSVSNPVKKKGYDNIVKAITNAQELRAILDRYVDKLSMEQMPWIKLPEAKVKTHYMKASDAAKDIADDLRSRINNLKGSWKIDQGDDTMLGIYTTGRAGSIDPRLYESTHAGVQIFNRDIDTETDKIELAESQIYDTYKKNKNSGQIVFLDHAGHTSTHLDENIHSEIKKDLVKKGIIPKQIAIISGQEITNPQTGKERKLSGDRLNSAKQEIVDLYNQGEIRVIIGTTKSAGEGMDIQVKTTDIYHLDIPYTPGEFQQRNGRGVRYGNENDTVRIHYYFMRGTFDELSFNIVARKRGWNEAIWDKDAVNEIDTVAEMLGGMPSEEEIQLAMEEDPVKRRLLELEIKRSHLSNDVVAARDGVRRAERKIDFLNIKKRSSQRELNEDQKERNSIAEKLRDKSVDDDTKNKLRKKRKTLDSFISKNKRFIDNYPKRNNSLEKQLEHAKKVLEETENDITSFIEKYIPNQNDIWGVIELSESELKELEATERSQDTVEDLEEAENKKRIVNDDKYYEAKQNIIDKHNSLSFGFDPTLIKDYLVIGAYHVENLIRKGVKPESLKRLFRAEMYKDFGKKIRKFVNKIWRSLWKEFGKQLLTIAEKNPLYKGFTKLAEGPLFDDEGNFIEDKSKKEKDISEADRSAGKLSEREKIERAIYSGEKESKIDKIIDRYKEKLVFGKNKRETHFTSTLIKQRIKDLQRGYKLGEIDKERELQKIKQMISTYVRKNLPNDEYKKRDITKILTKIVRAKNAKGVEEAFNKIDEIIDNKNDENIRNKFLDLLKQHKPTTKSGRETGTILTADHYKTLDMIREVIHLDSDEVQERTERILESVCDGIELTEDQNREMFVLGNFGDFENLGGQRLKEVYEILRDFIAEGKFEYWQRETSRIQENERLRDEAIDAISGGEGLLTQEQARDKGVDTGKFSIDKYDSYNQSFEWLLDKLQKLDKDSGTLEGPLNKQFVPKILNARNNENKGLRDNYELFKNKLEEIYNKYGKELANELKDNTERKKTGIIIKQGSKEIELELSQNEAYKKYLEAQDPTQWETLDKMGYTSDVINQIEKWLKPEVKKWADWQIEEFYPEYYHSVNEVYRNRFYADLPYNQFYTPIFRDFQGGEADNQLLKEKSHYATVLNGHLKTRRENTLTLKLVDGDSVLAQHIIEMEHFKAWSEVIRQLRSVFAHKDVRNTIRQYHGKANLDILTKFIDDFARGGVDRSLTLNVLDKFRANFTKAVLGVNVTVFFKQLTSIPAYAMEIPVKNFVQGISDFVRNPAKAIRILSKSEMLKSRYNVGWERDVILAMKQSTSKQLAGTKSITDALMLTTRAGDKAAILIGGWGVYKYHYDKAIKEGKGAIEASKIAMEQFELTTKRAQQAGDVEDLADIQRQGSWAKLFTMFITAPNQYYRSVSGGFRNLIHGRGNKVENIKRIAIAHFILPALFQYVASGFPGLFSEWDDKDTLRQFRALGLGSLNGLLIAGDLLEGLFDALIGDYNYSFDALPIQSAVKYLRTGLVKIHNLIRDDTYTFDEFVSIIDQLLSGISKFHGVPYDPVKKLGEGLKKTIKGESESIMELFGYSDYALGDEKLSKELRAIRNQERIVRRLKKIFNNSNRYNDKKKYESEKKKLDDMRKKSKDYQQLKKERTGSSKITPIIWN